MSNDVGYGVCPICGSTMTPMGCVMGDQCQYRGVANGILDFFGIGDDDTDDSSSVEETTPPTTEPTTEPPLTSSAEETPRYLANSNYKGHNLSVKPESVEHVCNYLRNDVTAELDGMLTEVDSAYNSVLEYAASSPYPVDAPGDFDSSTATKAISAASDRSAEAANQVANIADAICQYGDGGWSTPANVLAHLNNFLGLTGGSGDGGGGGGGGGGASDDTLEMEPEEETVDTSSDDVEVVGNDLDVLSEEIVVSSIAGSIVDDTSEEFIAPSLSDDEILSEETIDTSDLTSSILGSDFASFVLPSPSVGEIDGTKSSSVIASTGIAAAAAAAVLGGKLYFDSKHKDEDNDENKSENENDEQNEGAVEETEQQKVSDENSQHEEILADSDSDDDLDLDFNMVDMKKKIYEIGLDGDE